MTANASRNQLSETSLMAPVAGKVTEAVLIIMQYFGIQKIEVKKLISADYERVVAVASPFEGTPPEVAECGYLIKESLAEILAATGVIKLEISAEEEDVKKLVDGYGLLIKRRKALEESSEVVAEKTEKPEESSVIEESSSVKDAEIDVG